MENSQFEFNTVSIIGIGMMGGSLALSLKKYNVCKKIIAFDTNPENLNIAEDLNIIDESFNDLVGLIKASDLIIICSPIMTYKGIFEVIRENLKEDTIITDIGSVKLPAVRSAITTLNNDQMDRFIAAHPIAGTEKSGPENSKDDLFENKSVIITPSSKSQDHKLIQKIQSLWKKIGSHVEYIEPQKHDFIYASVSHNIQLFCSCFCTLLKENFEDIKDDIDGIFLRFIRLSGSNPTMWKDIFLYNNKFIDLSIDIFVRNLSILEETIQNDESDSLEKLLALSAEKRKHFHAISNPINAFSNDADHYNSLQGKSKIWIDLLPRIIACVTMECISENEYSYATGAGINDFSRNMLLSNATDHKDILLNKTNILKAIEQYKELLNKTRLALNNQDKEYLEGIILTGNEVYKAVNNQE